MIISWILALFFLLVIIGEMYFIGKYISITQGIFSNKAFGSFTLGAAVYIFASFFTIAPFAPLSVSPIYFTIILVIKDFFTIVFLITRREKFVGVKFNWNAGAFVLLSAVIIPILFDFVIPHMYTPEELDVKNNFQTWNKFFVPAFTSLTKFELWEVRKYLFAPLASVILFTTISALFLNFYNKEKIRGCAISFGFTIGFIFLFNFKLNIYDMIGFAMLLFAFLTSYNLIMFSRRRYGALFGILVADLWSLAPQLFWATLILGFTTSITYSYLRKPKAALFTLQLIIPIMITAALLITDFSNALALSIVIVGVILYILIFVVNRFSIFEDASKWTPIFNIAWPIILIVAMLSLAFGIGFTRNDIDETILFKENLLFDKYDNDVFSLIQNITYYVLFVFLGGYTLILYLRKDRILKLKLVIIITFFAFLFGYNPAFQAIMMYQGWEREFGYSRLVAIAPIAIIAASHFRFDTVKNAIVNKIKA